MAGDEETVKVFDCDSLLCLCEWKAHENRYSPKPSLSIWEEPRPLLSGLPGCLSCFGCRYGGGAFQAHPAERQVSSEH